MVFDHKGYHREWYQKNKEKLRQKKRLAMRQYRLENPEKFNLQSRNHKAKTRKMLFFLYGSRCALCGFDNAKALTLDHILRNGNIERKMLGERGVYRRALEKNRPEEYRILCMNCQFINRG